jgi:hypothetical protein
MGFNTVVLLLNDSLSELEHQPELFVKQLVRAVQESYNKGKGHSYVVGQATVTETHHADDRRIYTQWANNIFDVSPYGSEMRKLLDDENYDEILRQADILADAAKTLRRMVSAAKK